MEYIKNKKILALVGIVCLLLGTMLPYITISFWGYEQSLSLWGYWEGKIIMLLTFINALFIFKDWIEDNIPSLFKNNIGQKIAKIDNPKVSLIPTILVVVFAIYLYTTLDFDSEYMSNGIGFYILWVGVIALIGHAIFYKNPVEKVSTNYGSIQNNVNQVQQPGYVQPNNINQVQQPETYNNFMQQPLGQNMPQTVNDNSSQPQSAGVKFCPNCGTQANLEAKNCIVCGKNL